MRRAQIAALLFGFLALSAVHVARADEGDDIDEKDVKVLTTKNFDEIVKKSKFALVEFYAPWCGHCKSLKPHYAAAATELKEYDADIVIGKVDATVESELGTKFEVKGYPTLKWFVDGELHSDYNGGRDTEGLVKWVKKKTGPATTKCDSAADLKKLETADVVVVGYFKELSGDDYEAFKKIATKTEDMVFAETTDAEVAEAAGIKAAPGASVVKNFKGEARETVALEGAFEAEKLEELMIAEKLPLTIPFNKDNAEKIFNSGIKKHVIVWSKAADLDADSKLMTAIKAISKEFKGKAVFVTSNNEDAEADPITKHFGLTDSPTVLGFEMEKNKKYKYKGEIDEKAIQEFVSSVIDGSATPDYKSQEIPEDNIEDHVTVVVGKSFGDIVLAKDKDVLLEVYAPWCGHCKKLAPIYTKLAKRFAKVDSVVIAKFDATENEHEMVDAQGFPTILFYPAGDEKKVVKFEGGDRSLKALTKFIKQHATIPYELPKKSDKEEDETSDLKTEKDAKDEL